MLQTELFVGLFSCCFLMTKGVFTFSSSGASGFITMAAEPDRKRSRDYHLKKIILLFVLAL